ncbi:conserved hypothetical protein [Ricinus communis]|uniref:Uncharacterized protein n=1 Tax=Ricinus communis TaxID=3988 RepID=B9RU99_RICCO|nr:conserved hypothetical protein [Ricinus communis]
METYGLKRPKEKPQSQGHPIVKKVVKQTMLMTVPMSKAIDTVTKALQTSQVYRDSQYVGDNNEDDSRSGKEYNVVEVADCEVVNREVVGITCSHEALTSAEPSPARNRVAVLESHSLVDDSHLLAQLEVAQVSKSLMEEVETHDVAPWQEVTKKKKSVSPVRHILL